MSDQQQQEDRFPPADQQQQQQQQDENKNDSEKQQQQEVQDGDKNDSTSSSTAAAAAVPQRRKVNTNILGSIVTQTVVSNLPAGMKPIPEWKRKALEKEALARGETLPERTTEGETGGGENADGTTTTAATSLYRPPHQRLPPAPLVSQQAQERSAFPGDFWFHKEIENLIGKHRRKVHIRENEDDAFFDRGGKAGRGVIASYIVDAFPLIRNARPRHIREAMAAGDLFGDKTEIIDESSRKIMPGDDDFEEDEDTRDIKVGGGVEEDF